MTVRELFECNIEWYYSDVLTVRVLSAEQHRYKGTFRSLPRELLDRRVIYFHHKTREITVEPMKGGDSPCT